MRDCVLEHLRATSLRPCVLRACRDIDDLCSVVGSPSDRGRELGVVKRNDRKDSSFRCDADHAAASSLTRDQCSHSGAMAPTTVSMLVGFCIDVGMAVLTCAGCIGARQQDTVELG